MGLIARALERRASPYVQAFLRGDDMPNSWGAGGRAVTAGDALQIATVYACISRITETVATLPRHVYRRLPSGGKERANAHPAYPLLHDRPNPEMTAVAFWEALSGHVLLCGNGFAEIQRDRGDRPMALWPLRPDRMTLKRDERGELVYVYRLPGGEPITFAQRDILHLRGLSSNGLIGYSPIQLAAQTLGEHLDAETFGAKFWSNGSRPGGVLQLKNKLSDDGRARLKAQWEAAHQGTNNAWRVAVLEEGVSWQQIGLNMDQAQFLETRKFTQSEICGIYNVPLHKIGNYDHATFTNVEELNIDWASSSIRPWCVRFEQELSRWLIPEPDFYAEHVIDGLLRGKAQERFAAYAVGRQWGWLSADDVREKENMNPLPDGQGQIYLVPMNMVPADQMDQPQPAEGGAARSLPSEQRAAGDGSAASRLRLAKRYRRLFVDAATRVVRREVTDVRQAAQRLLTRDAASFRDWLREYYERTLPEAARRTLLPVMMTYADIIRDDALAEIGQPAGELTPEAERFVQEYARAFATAYAGRSRGQLEQQLRLGTEPDSEEDELDLVSQRLDEWGETRADKVADIETTRLSGAMTVLTWRMGGVRKIAWVTQGGKTCPYCRSLDGRVVGIESNFLDEGEGLDPEDADGPLAPSSDIRHPPAHSTCVCGLAPA